MSDDRELQAAQWVEARAPRLRVMFGAGASLLAAGIFLVGYLSLRDASLEETGVHLPIVSAGIAAVLAALPIVIALFVSKRLVRLRLDGWVAEASQRFGVPGDALGELLMF
jgi:ABC-type Fe3+-siderophore transport system permease subunit